MYKKIKKIDKFLNTAEHSLESGNFGECIEQAGKVLKAEDTVIDVIFNAKKLLCSCYVKVYVNNISKNNFKNISNCYIINILLGKG